MIRILGVILTIIPALVFAGDREDLAHALSNACITPLETKTKLAAGFDPAPDAMAAKLLNGKDATLWRHENSKIVIVAHNTGETCEVMGMGLDMNAVAISIRGWAEASGYIFSEGENMDLATGGGAYLVRALDTGFVQIFVHTDAERGFVGVTASRVKESTQAREVLGE